MENVGHLWWVNVPGFSCAFLEFTYLAPGSSVDLVGRSTHCSCLSHQGIMPSFNPIEHAFQESAISWANMVCIVWTQDPFILMLCTWGPITEAVYRFSPIETSIWGWHPMCKDYLNLQVIFHLYLADTHDLWNSYNNLTVQCQCFRQSRHRCGRYEYSKSNDTLAIQGEDNWAKDMTPMTPDKDRGRWKRLISWEHSQHLMYKGAQVMNNWKYGERATRFFEIFLQT